MIDKASKSAHIIDVACPFDTRVKRKEKEKIDNYMDLKYEIARMWKSEINKVLILPIVIGALGTVSKNLEKNLVALNFEKAIETLQKACLLGSARILRKVLDCKECK